MMTNLKFNIFALSRTLFFDQRSCGTLVGHNLLISRLLREKLRIFFIYKSIGYLFNLSRTMSGSRHQSIYKQKTRTLSRLRVFCFVTASIHVSWISKYCFEPTCIILFTALPISAHPDRPEFAREMMRQ